MSTACDPRRQVGPRHRTPDDQIEATALRINRGEPHPTAGTPPGEIVSHLVRVHHRSLREGLSWIRSLLDKAVAEHLAGDEWTEIAQSLAVLDDELACCLLQERSTILRACGDVEWKNAPELRAAVRAIGKTHASLLQRFWTFTARVTEVRRARPGGELGAAIAAELSDLVDDYYQHLYEEECLLFPQLTSASPNGAGACE
jgi:iron-sulfur cluster repair protein YtfE (RIC family)